MLTPQNRRARLVAGLATAALIVPAAFASADPTLYDVTGDCTVASTMGTPGFRLDAPADPTVLLEPDDGRNVDLDVLVLLDGVTQTRAEEVFADVAIPYAEVGITVVPTYQTVSPAFTSTDAGNLITEAKGLFPGGDVPAAYDVVEVLTSKDITGPTGTSTAGLAYCVGGIQDPGTAFEVSEAADGTPRRMGPLVIGDKRAAKVTAHELGHLLGGQHELANCAEPAPAGNALTDGPCTLMANDTALISLHFSSANAAFVRGYALRYAD